MSPAGGWGVVQAAGAAVLLSVLLMESGCAARAPRLQSLPEGGWSEVLRRHRGDVLVVNVWASWCKDCLELMPAVVEIHQRYSERPVAVVSACLDEPDDGEGLDRAGELVKETGAAFPHYLSGSQIAEALAQFDLDDVPAVLVYGPDGGLRHRLEPDPWEHKVPPEVVEAAIEGVLRQSL